MAMSQIMIPIRPVMPEDPHTRLTAAGWKRQTTIGEPRLSELVQNYRSLGYEVHVESSTSDSGSCSSGCRTCFDAGEELGHFYGTVYIRPASSAPESEELF